MKPLCVFLAVVAMALIYTDACTQPQVDYEALASKLVHQCARIREGDLVFINGGLRDAALLEDIAVHVRTIGAFPLLSWSSDRLARRLIADVPAAFDSQTPLWDLKLNQLITAQIYVEWNETPGLFLEFSPERLAAMGNAAQPVSDLLMKRNVRQIFLGNGLYPTAARAKQFQMSQDELAKIFWEGVNVDYTTLQAAGERFKKLLSSGKEVHITNRNGTDLKMRIEGRPVFVSDGVISSEDEQRGGAACMKWLPAGEVYLAPVAGTTEGTVVVDRQPMAEKEILGLRLIFKKGKLTSMTATSGLELLKKLYDAAGEGKDIFGFVDIGINANVRIPEGSRMEGFMPAGMVTIGFGQNTWAGGDNTTPFGSGHFLPGSTLTVDGKIVVEKGVLKD